MNFLVDGDIVAYRCACAVDNNDDATETMARYTVDHFMAGLLCRMAVIGGDEYSYEVYLTGDVVFREDVAVTAPYKGNRTKPRPTYYHQVRDQLMKIWGAVIEEPLEADDLIAISASKNLEQACIMSLDKDFEQVNCKRWDFVKEEMFPAQGELNCLRTLYKQCLTGDTIDNIIGVEGIGPGTASELIDNMTEEHDMALVCVDQLGRDRFIENMRLVYLLRDEQDWYVPPTEIYDEEFYCNVH